MKRIVNYWIFGLAIAGMIAGGCAGIKTETGRDFTRNDTAQVSNLFATNTENIQEVWIIERNSSVTNVVQSPQPSSLRALVHGQELAMPLKHMDVNATINGYISTVDIKQEFENPYAQKIEAVYEFTLPEQAVVDDFVMTIGKRRIRGIIRDRITAEAMYEQASLLGYLVILLSANQTNGIRQTIANIEPGSDIDVDIHYFQTLHFEDGWYEFLFPTGSNSKGISSERHVPLSLRLELNAGAAIADMQCPDYVVKKSITSEHWTAQLDPQAETLKEDFKLRYRLAKDRISPDFMSYQDERGGYFTLLLHPPNDSLTLANVKIDFGTMRASDIYPSDFTSLPAGRGVLIAGRFIGTLPEKIVVTGNAGNEPISFSVPVDSSKTVPEKVLPKIWATLKIAAIKKEASRTGDFESLKEIRQIALDYGLVSPFTTFLAVDASEPTKEGKTITVPAVP